MKNLKRKALIGASILVLLLSVLFVVRFITNPYYIVGLPTPLFYIRNMDEGAHELRVEVFDSENNSVFNKNTNWPLVNKSAIPIPSSPGRWGLKWWITHSNSHWTAGLRKSIVRKSILGALLK